MSRTIDGSPHPAGTASITGRSTLDAHGNFALTSPTPRR